jgi:hypothetical protein
MNVTLVNQGLTLLKLKRKYCNIYMDILVYIFMTLSSGSEKLEAEKKFTESSRFRIAVI